MAQKPQEQRSIKNVLINKPLQREFTLVIIGVMMIAGFFVGILIKLVLADAIQTAPNTISRYNFEKIIGMVHSQLIAGSIVIIFLSVIAVGFLGVLFLHRVAGPAYRFGQVLKRMARGDIPNEIQLRPRDFFKEVAEDINQVIRYLRNRDLSIRRIEENINQINDQNLAPDIKEKIDHVRRILGQIHKP